MDPSIFNAVLEQMFRSPATLMDVIGLSVLAYLLEVWPRFHSRMVSPLIIVLGPLTYWCFAAKGSVPLSYPYPAAVLIVNGLVAGLLATALHAQLIRRILGVKETDQKPNGDKEKDNDQ